MTRFPFSKYCRHHCDDHRNGMVGGEGVGSEGVVGGHIGLKACLFSQKIKTVKQN